MSELLAASLSAPPQIDPKTERRQTSLENSAGIAKPIFGFFAFTSGSLEGAIIRDIRLANELHRRGYRVFVYWMMEQNRDLVAPGIVQRVLCTGGRYQFPRPSTWMDRFSQLSRIFPRKRVQRFLQQHPAYMHRLMSNCCRTIVDGDPGLSRRLAKAIARDGVTHLLPTFAMICPFAQAARKFMPPGKSFEYLVTFQGEEIFANFAKGIGRLDDYHQKLREVVAASPWPAVAVSRDYIGRLSDEMGIDPTRLRPIYPGIELPAQDAGNNDRNGSAAAPADIAATREFATVRQIFKSLRPDLPIITFLGRQDSEKGIDLLLYACKILSQRGVRLQVLCVGGTSFGHHYRQVCEQIAEHLRLPVFWKRRVSDEARSALYRVSRCIAYPSIHREPFGMVAAEAMSHGTPVIVPDIGGITEVIESNGRHGGITFRSWNSGDLADQLQRLIADDALHHELASNARAVAANFSVERMTDRVLEHLGIQAAVLVA